MSFGQPGIMPGLERFGAPSTAGRGVFPAMGGYGLQGFGAPPTVGQPEVRRMIRNEPGMPAQFQGMSQGSVPDSGLGTKGYEGSGFPSEVAGFQGVPPLPLPAAAHSPPVYHSGFEPGSAQVRAGLVPPPNRVVVLRVHLGLELHLKSA